MIKELVNFVATLSEEFKSIGSVPKEGLHVLLKITTNESGMPKIDCENYEYELFTKRSKKEISSFLNRCKLLHQNAWCLDTNKCFDLPTKAIHSCSPFVVAFKCEHLVGGGKYEENDGRKKKQIYERFGEYFSKAFALLDDAVDIERYNVFKYFFIDNCFSFLLSNIEIRLSSQRNLLEEKLFLMKERQKNAIDKTQKEEFKNNVSSIEQELLNVRKLEDSDYLIFYLDLPLDLYKQAYKRYLNDKLFNTALYNTKPDANGLVYGTSNFMNGFNSNMPFLMHQTATFDISGRISNTDAELLNELKNILPNKTLPNPLPIFIYKEEIQVKIITIFNESGFKFKFNEIIQKLIEDKYKDIGNYYLLFWQNTKDGIVFKDFDFVSCFEYLLPRDKPCAILNLFEIMEKGGKEPKHYSLIKNIFDFEQQVFKPFIQNKYLRVDYFGDLNKEDYSKLDLTFSSFAKYRKAIYDYVYKSRRNAINEYVFYELAFNAIKDNIKNNDFYGAKEKLNIWYSLFDYFNVNNKYNMVDKLKEYQGFVAALISEETITDVSDEKFAFAAGQVIKYILSKSKSADNSYSLLEPYLQQSKCSEFKLAIANDFARYKHVNFSNNFEKVAMFVLSYETLANIKNLLPQLLSGVFAKNQLYSKTN